MNKRKKIKRIIWIIILIVFIFWLFKIAKHYPKEITLDVESDFWGVTFSKKFSQELGLDWKEVYLNHLK